MIYLLKRIQHSGHDEYDSKVVRAPNEAHARVIANDFIGDEGQIWEDHEAVTCEALNPEGEPCEILGSFNAG